MDGASKTTGVRAGWPGEAQVVNGSLHMLYGHRAGGLWEVWQVCCLEVLGPESPTGP